MDLIIRVSKHKIYIYIYLCIASRQHDVRLPAAYRHRVWAVWVRAYVQHGPQGADPSLEMLTLVQGSAEQKFLEVRAMSM